MVLKTTIILLTALSVMATSASAVTIKIATLAPEGSGWMTEMRKAAKEIKGQTEGRVKFKFYGGGVMGNENIVLKKMRIGQLHGGAFTAGGLASVYPDILLYNMPLLFQSTEEVDAIRREFDPILSKGLEDKGYINFGFAEGGFAVMMANKSIVSAADLAGEKVWVPEGDNSSYLMMKELGVSPVSLQIPDVLTGLQTGLVSIVGTSPIGAIAFQWHTRVSHVSSNPLVYLYATMAIDKRVFRKISATDQTIVRTVLNDLYKRLDKQNRVDNASAFDALKTQGLTLMGLSDDERTRWQSLGRKVAEKLANEGALSKQLYQDLQARIDQLRKAQ